VYTSAAVVGQRREVQELAVSSGAQADEGAEGFDVAAVFVRKKEISVVR